MFVTQNASLDDVLYLRVLEIRA